MAGSASTNQLANKISLSITLLVGSVMGHGPEIELIPTSKDKEYTLVHSGNIDSASSRHSENFGLLKESPVSHPSTQNPSRFSFWSENKMCSRFSRQWLWRMVSSGMLRRVALVRTDVSEELSASVITWYFFAAWVGC
jgi:hypothetical protein